MYEVSLEARKVLIEKDRNASWTLKVATAESFLPVKGYTSGPLWAAVQSEEMTDTDKQIAKNDEETRRIKEEIRRLDEED